MCNKEFKKNIIIVIIHFLGISSLFTSKIFWKRKKCISQAITLGRVKTTHIAPKVKKRLRLKSIVEMAI